MEELKQAFAGLDLRDPSKAQEVSEILDKFNLRWNVSVQPLFLKDSDKPTGILGVVREDTGKVLTACKSGYTPFQNSRTAELVSEIAGKAGYDIHNGGEFNGGGKIYIQLDTHAGISDLGENKTKIKTYVTGINSHDGSSSLSWGNVAFDILCGNTFARARKLLKQRARHTSGIFSTVDLYLRELHDLNNDMQNMLKKFRDMASREVGGKEITAVVKEITGFDPKAVEVSTYTQNRASELLASISAEMKAKGNTAWGLFSGVTHYTQYTMPVPKRANARTESKYVGSAYQKDNTAFAILNN